VDAVVENHNTLFGKLSSTLTNAEKDEVWDQVLARVNSVSSTIRNKEELKKKYQSLKSEVKSKEASNKREIRKTGGGDAELEDHDELSQKILTTLPAVIIEGIRGGYDSSGKTCFLQCDFLSFHYHMSLLLITSNNLDRRSNFRPDPMADEPHNSSPTSSMTNTTIVVATPQEEGFGNGSRNPPDPTTVPVFQQTSRPKKGKRKKPNESTLYNLQARQVELLEDQVSVLKSIASLMETRNKIERKKLLLKKRKYESAS
jgi:hypothetical protein